MSFFLNKSEMIDMCVGACILGTGGGGSCQVAIGLINKNISDEEVVEVLDVSDVDDESWLAGCCLFGPPSMAPDTENICAYSALNAISKLHEWRKNQCIEKKTSKLSCILPMETGAINLAVPLLAAASLKIPLVNADITGGRSVPALPLTTLLGSVTASPACIVSHNKPGEEAYNSCLIEAPDEQSTQRITESIVTSEAFGGEGGFAGYYMNGNTLKQSSLYRGAITTCVDVGRIFKNSIGRERVENIADYFTKLSSSDKKKAKPIFHGLITNMTKLGDAYDSGKITVTNNFGEKLFIHYQNESIYAINDGAKDPYITAPDSICFVPRNDDALDIFELWNRHTSVNKKPTEIDILAIDSSLSIKNNYDLLRNWGEVRRQNGAPLEFAQSWL